MTILVQTSYLRGYAAQLVATKEGALDAMLQYTRQHCGNLDGLDGTLSVARPGLASIAESMVMLIDAAKGGLGLTAIDLRAAADAYDRSDWMSAERVWAVGREWVTPQGWQDNNAAGSGRFTGGPAVDLPAPPFTPEVEEAKAAAYQALGSINDVVRDYFGYDLLAKVLPLLFGEWGAVKRIGAAYGTMEHAFRDVAADLGHGVDVLSSHWNSRDDGRGASQAFDYHIRGRWMVALDALAQMCDTIQQMCEAMAAEYEHTVKGLLFMLNFYGTRIKSAIKSLISLPNWKTAAWNIYSLVSAVWQLIEDTIAMAVEQMLMFGEVIESAVATAVMLRNQMDGDFDALKVR